MFPRNYKQPKDKSFFLFGPRGTGKTTWLKEALPEARRIDLLDEALFQRYLREPQAFYEEVLATPSKWVVLDEVQRLPGLLNYVHKLIEEKRICFALTGSSARKLKKENANMLAGRALDRHFFPLTAAELGDAFVLQRSLLFGHLPMAVTSEDPKRYLDAYVGTYLREEVQQEALVRNLAVFSRFLESLALSQASVISAQAIATDLGIDRKTVQSHIDLVEDLLIGTRLQPFQKRAKRKLTSRPKFFYFDVGVYRALRPRGPLDSVDEIDGAALETLVLQELRAHIEQNELDLAIHFFRTQSKTEVDFVCYGGDGFSAIEVKRSARLRPADFDGLKVFHEDYPEAKCFFLYLGEEERLVDGYIHVIPVQKALFRLHTILG